MRRVLVPAAFAAIFGVAILGGPVCAAEPATNALGIPIAPMGGMDSIHQWGGVDDQFAVNPDGDEAPTAKLHATSPTTDQDDDSDDPDGDTDHADEILPI